MRNGPFCSPLYSVPLIGLGQGGVEKVNIAVAIVGGRMADCTTSDYKSKYDGTEQPHQQAKESQRCHYLEYLGAMAGCRVRLYNGLISRNPT